MTYNNYKDFLVSQYEYTGDINLWRYKSIHITGGIKKVIKKK